MVVVGPEMAPKPPTLGAPRRSHGAPRSWWSWAPRWPPNPQRSERPGVAMALLDHGGRGPRNGPQAPNARSAPAQPYRSSITVVVGPEMAPKPQHSGRPGAAVALLHHGRR